MDERILAVLSDIRALLTDIRNMTAVVLEHAIEEANDEEAHELNRHRES